jgi:hypothetical protein
LKSSIDPGDAASPPIKFHHYQFATKCAIHDGVLLLDTKTGGACEQTEDEKKRGKVRKQQHLTLLSQPIGVFIKDLYLPSL